jgi:hypothetical protein
MKNNNNYQKTILIVLLIVVLAWLGFLTYKIHQVATLEQENTKASAETSVRLINEINKLNQKLEQGR